MKAIELYEELVNRYPGLGRKVAIELSKDLTYEELVEGFDFGMTNGDKAIWNTFLTALGFQRNSITA